MKLLRNLVVIIRTVYHNTFNLPLAVVSALFNGPIAAAVNSSYGPEEYIYAGLWQAFVSFFSTGVTGRVVQHFSPIKNPIVSYILGSLIPAAMTFIGSASVHYLQGTPEVLATCIVPTALSLGSSFGTNFLTRRGYMRPENYPKDEN